MLILLCNLYKKVDDLFPHFYKHYRNRGVERFCFGVWEGEKNPVWNWVKERYPDVILDKSYDGDITAEKETESHRQLQKKFGTPEDWYVLTDLDEFHNIEWANSFNEAIEFCKTEHTEYIVGHIIDRMTIDGTIPLSIAKDIDIFLQFPREANLTQKLLNAWHQKVSIAHGSLQIYNGHHYAMGNVCSKHSATYHFKWFGNLIAKEQEKLEIYKRHGDGWWQENERLVKHLMASDNKLPTIL